MRVHQFRQANRFLPGDAARGVGGVAGLCGVTGLAGEGIASLCADARWRPANWTLPDGWGQPWPAIDEMNKYLGAAGVLAL